MSKLPDNVKKVFKGILFDVYQWEQELFDGSHVIFEKIKRIPTVQLIALTPEKKIILLKEEQPNINGEFIALPGGQIEREHSVEETVHKELLEELGMKTDEIIFWCSENLGSKIEWTSYYYILKNCKKVQEPELEPGEKIRPYKVPFEEFLVEIQKEEFRNKALANKIFRIEHTPGELEKFKKLLFD